MNNTKRTSKGPAVKLTAKTTAATTSATPVNAQQKNKRDWAYSFPPRPAKEDIKQCKTIITEINDCNDEFRCLFKSLREYNKEVEFDFSYAMTEGLICETFKALGRRRFDKYTLRQQLEVDERFDSTYYSNYLPEAEKTFDALIFSAKQSIQWKLGASKDLIRLLKAQVSAYEALSEWFSKWVNPGGKHNLPRGQAVRRRSLAASVRRKRDALNKGRAGTRG